MPEKQSNDLFDDQTNEEFAGEFVRAFKGTLKMVKGLSMGKPLPPNNAQEWLDNLIAEVEQLRKEEAEKNAN